MLQERVLLGLRSSGLGMASLIADFDYDLEARQAEKIRWLLEEKMALLEGGILRLTPKGYLLCDEICHRLFP
jgi:coproporphyrinogen III oxidase-like Fe-S oxidoreductase